MTKVSSMTNMTGAEVDQTADLMPIVDMSLPAGPTRNKHITIEELLGLVDADAAMMISDLTDVSDATPNDGDVLTFDQSSGEWYPAAPQVGGGGGSSIVSIDDLVDVNNSSPNDGDVLTWDQSAGEYFPAAPTSGGGSGLPSFTEPIAADFGTSRSAGGSPSFTDATGNNATGILFTTARNASRQHSFQLKSVGSPPFTVEAFLYANTDVDDPFWWTGIAVGDTSANQHAYMGFSTAATGIAGIQLSGGYLSSLTAVESLNVGFSGALAGTGALLKLEVTASQILGSWSPDGEGRVWHPFTTITISGNFTNGVTMAGFHSGYVGSSGTNRMWCPHFRVY